jgi:uncharacterized membrane protein YkoI
MLRKLTLSLTAALLMAGAPALAQSTPPEGALPLSQVIAQIEAMEGVRFIDEVDWDDDGYWEVEYVMTDGRKVEVRLDPMTGQPRR